MLPRGDPALKPITLAATKSEADCLYLSYSSVTLNSISQLQAQCLWPRPWLARRRFLLFGCVTVNEFSMVEQSCFSNRACWHISVLPHKAVIGTIAVSSTFQPFDRLKVKMFWIRFELQPLNAPVRANYAWHWPCAFNRLPLITQLKQRHAPKSISPENCQAVMRE